ncbi:hypothetical protein [Streptomyces albidoflavus]|uniref:hypothetical protein n=1 Tax=Streptomyces albidoflavus TaxID=1886 RepID=UPI0033E30595
MPENSQRHSGAQAGRTPTVHSHWWSVSSSCLANPTGHQREQLRKGIKGWYSDDPYGYMALVPCGRGGQLLGPASVLSIELTSRSPAQLDLLAALCAHVISRTRRRKAPRIYTSYQDVKPLLDLLLGRRTQRSERRSKFTPLPELEALVQVLGDEVDNLTTSWKPRRSTVAMKRADDLSRLARKPNRGIRPDDWTGLGIEDVITMAEALGRLRQRGGRAEEAS